MTRGHVATVLAGISTVVLLAACGSTESNSPAASSLADSAPTVSLSASVTMTPASAFSTPNGNSPTGESAFQITAPQGDILVTVGTAKFSATLADSPTARAFADRLPLTLDMRDVNNNEKAFELWATLPGVATLSVMVGRRLRTAESDRRVGGEGPGGRRQHVQLFDVRNGRLVRVVVAQADLMEAVKVGPITDHPDNI